MFQTRVTEMLGIEHPLIVGTMGYLSFAEFTAACANAGVFCCLPSSFYKTKAEMRNEIRKTKGLTDKPFGVSISLFPAVRPVSSEEYIDLCLEEGIRVIETSGRSPEPYAQRIKDGGAIFMHKCARVRDAVSAERSGADLIEIVGTECAGQPGMEDIGTVVALPKTVDSVKVPVIGGGGFGDARGFLACLALGAEGVLMGTRFMLTKECTLHREYKKALLEAQENSTVLIQRSLNNPSRVLRNKRADEILVMEKRGTTLEELLPLIRGDRALEARARGDIDHGIIHCGQVIGLIDDEPTIKEVVDSIISGAGEIQKRLEALNNSMSPRNRRAKRS